MVTTLVHYLHVHKGLQSVLFEGSVVKSPQRALVKRWIIHMGVRHDPLLDNKIIRLHFEMWGVIVL